MRKCLIRCVGAVFLAVLIFALCGCGKGSGQGDGKEPNMDTSMTGQEGEEKEPVKIIFAVKTFWYDTYKPFVDSFNEKHSDCQVILKKDYYKSKILEKAQVGEGPVLIDTFITGFEEQKDLWEPIDDLYEIEDLQGALFDNVVELCRIDGTAYGVIADFGIQTCVTKDPVTSEEWTYEYFMNAAKERELEAVFLQSYGSDVKSSTVEKFIRNFEDSYILDLDREGYVNEEHLNEVLDLVDRYAAIKKRQNYDWNQAFKEGKVLCCERLICYAGNPFYIRKDLGWDISFVGYPSPEGGRNYIDAHSSIAIRRSSSEEEKRVAREFLLEVLSYDGQMNAYKKCKNNNYTFSIRRDVFEYQCGKQPAYVDMLKELAESARGRMYTPDALDDALYGAVSYHFEKQTTREELVEKLQNLLGEYLDGGEG